MKVILTFLILTTLSVDEPITKNDSIPAKEHLFLSMERTPCFGKCPSYKIMIFNTGNVVYEGFFLIGGKHAPV